MKITSDAIISSKNVTAFVFLFLPVLFLTSGCAPTIKEQMTAWGMDKYELIPYREALLAKAFTEDSYKDYAIKREMKYFSKQQEEFAQKALTEDASDIVTTWTNSKYGELKLRPGKRYRNKHNGQDCRSFTVSYVEHSTVGIFKRKALGDGCLNPGTGRWEW
jgi:hypothetical protein